MCFIMARLWPMIFSPTGMPVCLQASSRQASAARSCAKHDHERNVMSCSQTLKNDTLTHPSLWADHSNILREVHSIHQAPIILTSFFQSLLVSLRYQVSGFGRTCQQTTHERS